jgi:hypothetical protein
MDWERLETIVSIESPWVRLLAERWRDDTGRMLDYWRAERAHSLVIAVIQGGRLLLPPPAFRPGLGRATLDLPGGRIPAAAAPLDAAPAILHRELGVPPAAIRRLRLLAEHGWAINSSFESQLLFGAFAELDPDLALDPAQLYLSLPFSRAGVAELLAQIECLQCRAVLHELLSAGLVG